MRKFTYRDFEVSHNPKSGCLPSGATVDWDYVHVDYGGEGDNRCGVASSLTEAFSLIDEWWDEHTDSDSRISFQVKWNPHRYRNPHITQRYDGQWLVVIHAALELRDALGSSVGSCMGSAYGATPNEAMYAAQEACDKAIETELKFSLSRPATVPKFKPEPPKATKEDIEALTKLLGL